MSRIPIKLQKKQYELTREKNKAKKENNFMKILDIDRKLLIVNSQIENRKSCGGLA